MCEQKSVVHLLKIRSLLHSSRYTHVLFTDSYIYTFYITIFLLVGSKVAYLLRNKKPDSAYVRLFYEINRLLCHRLIDFVCFEQNRINNTRSQKFTYFHFSFIANFIKKKLCQRKTSCEAFDKYQTRSMAC